MVYLTNDAIKDLYHMIDINGCVGGKQLVTNQTAKEIHDAYKSIPVKNSSWLEAQDCPNCEYSKRCEKHKIRKIKEGGRHMIGIIIKKDNSPQCEATLTTSLHHLGNRCENYSTHILNDKFYCRKHAKVYAFDYCFKEGD